MNKIFLYLLFLSSCSSLIKSEYSSISENRIYFLKDHSGDYLYRKQVVPNKQKKEIITKISVKESNSKEDKPVEQIVTVSTIGKLKTDKGSWQVLRPKISQYQLWLEGKKYSNKMRINLKERSLDIDLSSPVMEWNGKKSVKFPNDKSVFCYFSQLVECIRITSFFKKAIEHESGEMDFYIIWDGHPYVSELFSNVPNELFSKASLTYDSKIDKEYRFTLGFSDQKLFYHLSKDQILKKIFWVSQGLSLISGSDKKTAKKEHSEESTIY